MPIRHLPASNVLTKVRHVASGLGTALIVVANVARLARVVGAVIASTPRV